MTDSGLLSVVPAQLSFLAIYNPLLGQTDETIHDQIVFYTSRSSRLQRTESSVADDGARQEIDKNGDERLRQIGLAQGMVNFARNFSEGKSLDYVETDRSRTILHELEKDWWILASVDLTRLPSVPSGGAKSQRNAPGALSFQYSSREMCPPQLLLQHLLRAHSLFLLLHDFTLDGLYRRVGRPMFCSLLERFWVKFAWSWEVLLTGNPAVDIFNGIKLSAGGELGVGVGEEEWGSGERAVLEDLVTRTDGLVDMVVSRFGDAPVNVGSSDSAKQAGDPGNRQDGKNQWLGSEAHPRPSDGVIFTGTGAVSRSSIVRVSQWMESIYRFGDDAYGVGEDPNSTRRRRHRRRRDRMQLRNSSAPPDREQSAAADTAHGQTPDRPFSPGIPRPLVSGTQQPSQSPHEGKDSSTQSSNEDVSTGANKQKSKWTGFDTDTFMKYLTLGYGSPWNLLPQTPTKHPRVETLKQQADGARNEIEQENSTTTEEDTSATDERANGKNNDIPVFGRFILGLRDGHGPGREQEGIHSLKDGDVTNDSREGGSAKIVLRTIHIRLATAKADEIGETKELRAVIYVNQPFIFTFLFDPETTSSSSSLTNPSLYSNIKHQLGPLHKPLLSSTSPTTISSRITIQNGVFFNPQENNNDSNNSSSSSNNNNNNNNNNRISFTSSKTKPNHPIYDLVYDPSNLTIRSSIPNIPEFPHTPTDNNIHPWFSRIESVNTHHRLLNTYKETRTHSHDQDIERTYKTNRGWWIVWVRVSSSTSDDNNSQHPHQDQEAFLIRKASDYNNIPSSSSLSSSSHHSRNNGGNASGGGGGSIGGGSARFLRDLGGATSSSFFSDVFGSGSESWSGSGSSGSRFTEGLGLDARKYVEALLSLNK